MDNPYESPSALDSLAQTPNQTAISAAVIKPLQGTKGWARFLAILGFILSAFIALAGLMMVVMGAGIGEQMGFGRFGAMVGMIYFVMAFLYFYPALKLNQYASRIGLLLQNPTEANLVTALDAQRSFWKFVGIMMLIVLSLYALIFIFAMVAGLAGAGMSR